VLPFIGSVVLSSSTFMVSPWMNNGDALSYVKRNPNANYLKLLIQVARGINYLHTHDPIVVHDDIKASNILIADTGEACISDFGLSQKFDESTGNSVSTAWRAVGHVRWQAPELLLAEAFEEVQRTTKSDIFAFGRVILELFTRKAPFANIPDMRVAFSVMNGTPPPRPTDEDVVARGLDDAVWRLMTDCWEMVPSARPSATDVVSRLQHITLPTATSQGPTPYSMIE